MSGIQQVLPIVPEKPSIRQGLRLVDRAQAARWLDECPYARNRVPNQSFVDGLVTALKRGEWNIRELQFAVLPDGSEQLLDGQHGLLAIKQSGISAWCRIAWQDFEDQEAVDKAYSRIDAGRPRNMRDALTALHVGLGVLERPSDIARLSAAITLMQTRMSGFGAMTNSQRAALNLRNRDEKARLCKEWLNEMQMFCRLTDKPLKRLTQLFNLSGVTAVGLITIRYQPDKAAEFWDTVAQTATLPHGSPTLQLRSLCESGKSKRGGPYVVRYTANAWNAWFRKIETMSKLAVMDERSKIRIFGTPYTGSVVPGIEELPSLEEWNIRQVRWGRKGEGDVDEESDQVDQRDQGEAPGEGGDLVGAGAGLRTDHATGG